MGHRARPDRRVPQVPGAVEEARQDRGTGPACCPRSPCPGDDRRNGRYATRASPATSVLVRRATTGQRSGGPWDAPPIPLRRSPPPYTERLHAPRRPPADACRTRRRPRRPPTLPWPGGRDRRRPRRAHRRLRARQARRPGHRPRGRRRGRRHQPHRRRRRLPVRHRRPPVLHEGARGRGAVARDPPRRGLPAAAPVEPHLLPGASSSTTPSSPSRRSAPSA